MKIPNPWKKDVNAPVIAKPPVEEDLAEQEVKEQEVKQDCR